MPVKRKLAPVPANASNRATNTSAELNRLERQKDKTAGTKSSGATPVKGMAGKSANASAGSGSKIDFKYQKPAGGKTAVKPAANAKGSGTPRVSK
jgi:hypothetical protein